MTVAPTLSLAMLRARFLTGLERRVSALECGLEVLTSCESGESRAPLVAMMYGFHSLAGIGGSYGFREITELASVGEAACESLPVPLGPEDIEMLAHLLEALNAAASSARSSIARQEERFA